MLCQSSARSLHLCNRLMNSVSTSLDIVPAPSRRWCTTQCAAASHISRRTLLGSSAASASVSSSRQAGSFVAPTGDAAGMPVEADLLNGARAIVPPLSPERFKGQAGKVGTVGGCREYTGAPYFASISALKVGADLSHVFCTEGAATVIKSYSPELIVHPYLPDSNGVDDPKRQHEEVLKGAEAVEAWLGRFDVVVVGPGLGRDPWVQSTVEQVVRSLRKDNTPVVIDADGLHILKHNLQLLKGWTAAVLTPNRNEFKRLADAVGVDVKDEDPAASLPEVAKKLGGPLVVQKGSADTISDGVHTIACTREGSPRRAGGQGDVLSGTTAAFLAWAVNNPGPAEAAANALGLRPAVLAAYGACATVREASKAAFTEKRRAQVAGDIIDHLGNAVYDLWES